MTINPMDAPSGGITGEMPRRPNGLIGGDLLKALAAQKLLRDKQMAENQLAISQEADANTVVAKNEVELTKRSLDEVSKGVSGVLQNKQKRAQSNLNRVATGKGIANNPRPNMANMSMAQGGIVGFAEGQTVDAKIAAIKNSTTMSEKQKAVAIKQLYATEAEGQAKGLEGTRNVLSQNLNPAKLIGDGLGGINYLIGGGADLLASGANLANMPKIGAGLASFADENYASGKKYIDKGMFANTFLEGPDKEVAAAPVTTAPEGPAFEQTGRGTPPVVPSVAPAPAVASTEGLPTYNDKMRNIERALGARGLGGYSAAIQQLEDNEAAQETASRKVDVNEQVAKSTSRYQDMIVAERGTNNASKLLQKYGAELSATINADPAVQQARATLDEAIGNEKGVKEAQEILTAAQRSAYDRFENSEAGKAILAEIAGLKKAIEKYDGMFSGSTQSDTVTAALEAIK